MIVSVVMATYNGEKYILEQLESLYKQTLLIDEVVICDDRSTDNTCSIINNFIKTNNLSNRWHLIVNEENLGYANNFHKALTLTNGDYIFFSDQDDIWHKNKVEEMVTVMEKNQNIMLLCCDFTPLVSTANAPKLNRSIIRKMSNTGVVEEVKLNYKNIYIGSLGCLMAMRKEFIQKAEKYWYNGWPHDEYVWKLSQCMEGCYILHKNLIQRRLHSHNVSMRKIHDYNKRIKYLEDLLNSHKATLRCAIDNKMSKKSITVINRNIIATELRLDLFVNRNYRNIFKLLPYNNCYHSRKSILMEPYIILKSKKPCEKM